MNTGLNGGILGGKTESVKSHREEDVVAVHSSLSRNHLKSGISLDVSDVHTRSARIGEFYERVELGLFASLLAGVGCVECFFFIPTALPFLFKISEIVSHNIYSLIGLVFNGNSFGVRIELVEVVELAHLAAENVNDNSAVVHNHPRVIGASSLNAVCLDIDLFKLILNLVGKSLDVGVRLCGAKHEVIGEVDLIAYAHYCEILAVLVVKNLVDSLCERERIFKALLVFFNCYGELGVFHLCFPFYIKKLVSVLSLNGLRREN